jgi:DNA repair protein RecO (recombination protein O)
MLQEMGYAVPLKQDVSDRSVIADRVYFYIAEVGASHQHAQFKQQSGVQLLGKTLLDMANEDYSDSQTQQQSKQLMRVLLAHYLGDKPLYTRQLLIDLQEL